MRRQPDAPRGSRRDAVAVVEGVGHLGGLFAGQVDDHHARRQVSGQGRHERGLGDFRPKLVFQVTGQQPGAVFDAFLADALVKADDFGQARHGGIVALPQHAELLVHRRPRLFPPRADDARPHLGDARPVDVQNAALQRAHEPLVGAAGVEVAAEVVQVEVEHPERLRAVHQREDVLFAGQLANRPGGQGQAARVGNVRKSNEPSFRRNRPGKRRHQLRRRRRRRGQAHLPDRKADPFGPLLPRGQVGGVVLLPEHHLVARVEVQAVHEEVVAFGGVAGDAHFVGPDAEVRGQRFEGFLPAVGVLRPVLKRNVFAQPAHLFLHEFTDEVGRGAQVGRVEHDAVGGHGELLLHLFPVQFFVDGPRLGQGGPRGRSHRRQHGGQRPGQEFFNDVSTLVEGKSFHGKKGLRGRWKKKPGSQT